MAVMYCCFRNIQIQIKTTLMLLNIIFNNLYELLRYSIIVMNISLYTTQYFKVAWSIFVLLPMFEYIRFDTCITHGTLITWDTKTRIFTTMMRYYEHIIWMPLLIWVWCHMLWDMWYWLEELLIAVLEFSYKFLKNIEGSHVKDCNQMLGACDRGLFQWET